MRRVFIVLNAPSKILASPSPTTILSGFLPTTFFLLINSLQRIATMMETDRPRCSVCGDYVPTNGWVLSHHELYCIQCARVNILVKSSSNS